MKILMVCLGNICRSPLAEALLAEKALRAGLNWQVESAGTNGFHTDEAPHRLSQAVAKKYGLDISKQKSRKFSREDFEKFDRIYAMADEVLPEIKFIAGRYFDADKVDLLMNELYPGSNRNIPDPWYGAIDGYHKVYELIDAACDALIDNYLVSKTFNNSFSKNPQN